MGLFKGKRAAPTLDCRLSHHDTHMLPHPQSHVEALCSRGGRALARGRALLTEVWIALTPSGKAGTLTLFTLPPAGAPFEPTSRKGRQKKGLLQIMGHT
jgi:hypothetical protein